MSLYNPQEQFDRMKDKTAQAVKDILNYEGRKNRLVVRNVEIQDKLNPFDFNSQIKAKDSRKSWSVPVRATVELQDKLTGKTLSRRRIKVADLPKITGRYSYIVKGREYQIQNQFRRDSGVYTRVTKEGQIQAVAAHKRKGQRRMYFDPATRQLTIEPRAGSSTAKINFYPLLKYAGISDEEIQKSWGKEVWEANRVPTRGTNESKMMSLAKRIKGSAVKTPEEAFEVINSEIKDLDFNPDITRDVLGKAHTHLTPQALKDIGKQLIQISKNKAVPSTYDSIGHKEFLTGEDILHDYLSRKKVELQRKIRNKIDREFDVKNVVRPRVFSSEVDRFFTSGAATEGLVIDADQTNPVAMLVGHTMTTIKGMGGRSTMKGDSTANQVHSSHIGFLDPIDTGEKPDTGLVLPMPLGATKKGNRIGARMYNMRTQRVEVVDPLVADRAIVAYPDDIRWVQGKPVARAETVRVAMPRGKPGRVPLTQVQYIMPSPQGQFNIATNLVPFLGNNNGNRVMMAAKMARQSVSLKDREQPLVQIGHGKDGTFEKTVGNFSAHKSPVDGVVTAVRPDRIKVKSDATGVEHDVHLYRHFQLNEPKTALNSEPLVKVGDKVKKGQVVADNNFTRKGTLALGTNLEVAYVPMKGYNFEDGVVISRSAAKKLTSQHSHEFVAESTYPIGKSPSIKELNSMDDYAVIIDKKTFLSVAPTSSRLGNIEKVGDDGIVKQGTVLRKGDIIVAIAEKRPLDSALSGLRKSTRIRSPWKARDIRWQKDFPGKVAKIVKGSRNVTVYVATEEPMTIGDKLVGRYGNKGVITQILEDKEMPFYTDEKGNKRVVEVALNPAGIPGRINPGQVFELGAAKIARKKGKPYKVTNFDPNVEDMSRKIFEELKKEGLSDQEELIDPGTGRSMGAVLTGPQYIQKLVHQVDKKLTSRSGGKILGGKDRYPYDLNRQPGKGVPHGGQAMSALGMYALLGHNARENIKEMQTHKSTYEHPGFGEMGYDSDEFWYSLMNGHPLPSPEPTFAYKKFEGYLKGMGLNPVKNDGSYQLVPLTDKDILRMSSHEVKDPRKMVKGVDGSPETGGLFDFPGGQIESKRWGHVKLAEPIPNPIFETAIEALLGLEHKKNGVPHVMSGKVSLGGTTGGRAIESALKAIDIDKEIENSLKVINSKVTGAPRTRAYKRVKVLRNLKKLGLRPEEAYIVNNMPILPPVMRPISMSTTAGSIGDIETADLNQMYKQVGMVNTALKEFDPSRLPEDRDKLRGELYNSMKSTFITGGKSNTGPINSILQTVAKPEGKQGKDGFYQSKIIKRRSELSGRSIIVPEPTLHLDQVGLPRKMAMEMYRPFVIRELKALGYTTLGASKKIETDPKDPMVQDALRRAVSQRPVMLKRDPVLHKYGVMAFNPTLHEGKAIQIHPLVTGGFNADFDGDSMGVFVPAGNKAAEEAKKMLPSKNLFSSTNHGLLSTPAQGSSFGIYALTKKGKELNRSYASLADMKRDFNVGQIQKTDVIQYKGRKTTYGRLLLVNKLPQELRAGPIAEDILYGQALTKGRAKQVLSRIAREKPELYAEAVDEMKWLGDEYAYESGASYSLKDFLAKGEIREKHLKIADDELAKIPNPTDRDRVRVYGEAGIRIGKELEPILANEGSQLYEWTKRSGALGSKWNQAQQILVSPLQVTDSTGNVIPEPIRKSYSEGMSTADYWTAVHGVRTGTLSRVKGTSDPGAKEKSIINLAINLPISGSDCGTARGAMLAVDNKDLEGRYLAAPVQAGNHTYPRNTLVTPDMILKMRKYHKQIKVRSPLTCEMDRGLCQKCIGLNENGELSSMGYNQGVVSGQALAEPLVQMAMNAFHTGGAASGAGAKAVSHFDRVAELYNMPKPGSMKRKAGISTVNGKVEKIVRDRAAGGHFVTIAGKQHRVGAGRDITVKVGDTVVKGQAISDGAISPHELLETAGIGPVRDYLTDQMYGIYGAYGVRRKHVETIVRNLTAAMEVVSDPLAEFIPKDIYSEPYIKKINRERKAEGLQPVKAKHIIKGIDEAVKVTTSGDWLAQLNYQKLEETLRNASMYGTASQLHGENPLPGMAYGAEFNDPRKKQHDWEY